MSKSLTIQNVGKDADPKGRVTGEGMPLPNTRWPYTWKLKFFIPCNPVILLSGTHFREILECVHYYTWTTTLIKVIFIIVTNWEKLKCSSTRNEWVNCYIFIEIYQEKYRWPISTCNNLADSYKYHIAGEVAIS